MPLPAAIAGLATAAAEGLPALLQGLGAAAARAGPAVEGVQGVLSTLSAASGKAGQAMTAMGGAVTTLSGAAGVATGAFGLLAGAVEKAGGAVTGVVTGLRDALPKLAAAAHAAGGSMASFVAAANPAAVQRFEVAFRDLQAVIGQILTPALDGVTAVTRTLADAVASLDGQTKGLLGRLAGGTGLAGVLSAVAAAVQPIGERFSLLAKAVIPPALNVLSALSTAFGAVMEATTPFVQVLAATVGPVLETVTSQFRQAVEVVSAVVGAFGPVGEVFAELRLLFASVHEAARELEDVFRQAVADVITGVVVPAVKGLLSVFSEVARSIRFVTNAFREFIGLAPLTDYDPKAKSSVGAAATQAQVTDIRAVVREQMSMAFMIGSGAAKMDYGKEQMGVLGLIKKELIDANDKLLKLPGKIAEAIKNGAANAAASAGSAVTSPAGIAAAAVINPALGAAAAATAAVAALDQWVRNGRRVS